MMRVLIAAVLLGFGLSSSVAVELEAVSVSAPALDLRGVDGVRHRLEDYRGRVVLVNFWASWCTPCLREMPGMQRLAEQMAGRPFTILAVNAGERKNVVENSRRRMGVGFATPLDPESVAFRDWGGQVLPTSFLIDPEGRVRYRVVGPLEWDGAEIVGVIDALLPATK